MSSSAAHLGALCFQAFASLVSLLQTAKPDLATQVPTTVVEDEFGRLRLWAANIGALGKGHSSLDYRLRDAPLVHEGVLKLLNELLEELRQMIMVLSGSRLPYELQQPSDVDFDDSDSSSSPSMMSSRSSSSQSERDNPPPTELRRRVSAVSDINDNLFRLSRSIRAPVKHLRSMKASTFKMTDEETGIDFVRQFEEVDIGHTQELFLQLRRDAQHIPVKYQDLNAADLAFIKRLSRGISRRRQQFLYWRSHRKKIGAQADMDPSAFPKFPPVPVSTIPLNDEEIKVLPSSAIPNKDSSQLTDKAKTEVSKPPTALTETTATAFIPPAPVVNDVQSVTSFATTARGLDGSKVELPKLPKYIIPGKDFECPYCQTICPSHYQSPRAWRTHLLRDLRPYICTYGSCGHSDELFTTRNEWQNHERSFHQRSWQCPEHSKMHFSTPGHLRTHLESEFHACMSQMAVEDLLDICESVRPDSRRTCMICLAETASSDELVNHMSNHLERFAAFAFSRPIGFDQDEESSIGSQISGAAIAKSDYSDASDKFREFDRKYAQLEAEALLKKAASLQAKSRTAEEPLEIFLRLYGPNENPLAKVSDFLGNLAYSSVYLDESSIDIRVVRILKAIQNILSQLEHSTNDYDEKHWEELAQELRYQLGSLVTFNNSRKPQRQSYSNSDDGQDATTSITSAQEINLDLPIQGSDEAPQLSEEPYEDQLVKILIGPEHSFSEAEYLDCKAWYLQYLTTKLKELPSISDNPDPRTYSLWFKMLCILARSVGNLESVSISGIVSHLQNDQLFDALELSLTKRQEHELVFIFIGWLTFLYEPASSMIRRFKDRGPIYGLHVIPFDMDLVAQPLYRSIDAYRALIPQVETPELSPHVKKLPFNTEIPAFQFAQNLQFGHITPIWVETLNDHLYYNPVAETLSIFRYPTFCRMMTSNFTKRNFLSKICWAKYHSSVHAASLPFNAEEIADRFFKELLLTYPYIFYPFKASNSPSFQDELPGGVIDPLLKTIRSAALPRNYANREDLEYGLHFSTGLPRFSSANAPLESNHSLFFQNRFQCLPRHEGLSYFRRAPSPPILGVNKDMSATQTLTGAGKIVRVTNSSAAIRLSQTVTEGGTLTESGTLREALQEGKQRYMESKFNDTVLEGGRNAFEVIPDDAAPGERQEHKKNQALPQKTGSSSGPAPSLPPSQRTGLREDRAEAPPEKPGFFSRLVPPLLRRGTRRAGPPKSGSEAVGNWPEIPGEHMRRSDLGELLR